MRGVSFNDIHSGDDWGLILNAKKINPPEPKYIKVSIDGRDGDLNLSRALTEDIQFNNREATFTFIATEGTQEEREELLSDIINTIHGQSLKIIEPDDEDHYLIGECKVEDIYREKAYLSFTVVADCEPYKYAINEVNRLISLSSATTETIITNAGRKTLIPTVSVSDSVKISIDDYSVELTSGNYILTAFKLRTGATRISTSGNGTVMLTFREAIL